MALKMRFLYYSKKAKMKDLAEAIKKEFDLAQNYNAIDVIPPAYSCDRERLVVIIASLKSSMPDSFRRFCQELSKDKAQNVALIVDGNETDAKMVADWIAGAGANVLENVLYFPVKGLFAGFAKTLTAEETDKVNAWYEDTVAALK